MKLNSIIFLAVVAVLCLLSFFIEIPYTFTSTAVIYPSQEWIIKTNRSGEISNIINNQKEGNSGFTSYFFERGDIARLQFFKELPLNASIQKGDTLGYIKSFKLEEEIKRLEQTLLVEKAYHSTLLTGEKSSAIEAAKNAYQLAEEKFELEKKNYDRLSKLFKDGIIPAAEFEIAENTYKIAATNIQFEKNNLLTMQTGEKLEIVNYSDAKIRSIISELNFLYNKKKDYEVIAPVSGKVISSINPDTLLRIIDTTNVLVVPVVLSDKSYIDKDTKFKLSLPGNHIAFTAKFHKMNDNLSVIDNRQVFYLIAIPDYKVEGIIPGMFLQCRVICRKITVINYILQKIRFTI